MFLAWIKSFFVTNALKLLQIGAAVLAVVLVLVNVKKAGRSAEKVEQYEHAIKARRDMDRIPRPSPGSVVDSLRKGTF